MKFKKTINYIFNESVYIPVLEGRKSVLSKFSEYVKIDPDLSDKSVFMQKYRDEVNAYFRKKPLYLISKAVNEVKNLNPTEFIADVVSELVSYSELDDYQFKAYDMFGVTVTTGDYVTRVKQSPVYEVTLDLLKTQLKTDSFKKDPLIKTVRNITALIRDLDGVFSNVESSTTLDVEDSEDSESTQNKMVEVVKSIKDSEIKDEIIGKLGDDVYFALRSIFVLGVKENESEFLKDMKEEFKSESINVKPSVVLSFMYSLGVIKEYEGTEEDENEEEKDEDESNSKSKFKYEIDPDFDYMSDNSYPSDVMSNIDSMTSSDRDYSLSNL